MTVKKAITGFATIALAISGACAITPAAHADTSATPSAPSASTSRDNAYESDFWFNAPDGLRTFNVEENALVANILESDTLTIEENVISVHNADGTLVSSIVAELPEGVSLKYSDGKISAHYAGSGFRSYQCIDNKWVGFGLGTVATGLVCAPLGVATGGIGGFACGTVVGAGITALSC